MFWVAVDLWEFACLLACLFVCFQGVYVVLVKLLLTSSALAKIRSKMNTHTMNGDIFHFEDPSI